MRYLAMDVAKVLVHLAGLLGVAFWFLSVPAFFILAGLGTVTFLVGFGLFLFYIKVDTAMSGMPGYWSHKRGEEK